MSTANGCTMQDADRGAIAIDAIEFSQAGHRMFVTIFDGGSSWSMATIVDNYKSTLAPVRPESGIPAPAGAIATVYSNRVTYLIKLYGYRASIPDKATVLLSSREPLRFDPISRRLELPSSAKPA